MPANLGSAGTNLSSSRRHVPLPIAHPRLWSSWLLWACLKGLARLPIDAQWWIGRRFGSLFWHFAAKRRRITLRNLELCIPELDEHQRHALAKESFLQLGMSAMETAWTWMGTKHLQPGYTERFHIEGLDYLEAARAEGRGVILIGAHLMSMDVIAPAIARVMTLDVIYRYNKNPLIERTMVNGRARYFPRVIEREDARAILTSLREGRTLWYAADQDYGARHSVFADFFGVPAATITGTARLANFNGSPVLMFSHYRDAANRCWSIHISPPLTEYPSGNAEFDAARTNALIEAAIRKAPEQYLWMHRRFKTRPVGELGVY